MLSPGRMIRRIPVLVPGGHESTRPAAPSSPPGPRGAGLPHPPPRAAAGRSRPPGFAFGGPFFRFETNPTPLGGPPDWFETNRIRLRRPPGLVRDRPGGPPRADRGGRDNLRHGRRTQRDKAPPWDVAVRPLAKDERDAVLWALESENRIPELLSGTATCARRVTCRKAFKSRLPGCSGRDPCRRSGRSAGL